MKGFAKTAARALSVMALCLSLFVAMPMEALAYKEANSYIDMEEWLWEVNNATLPEKTVKVSMYMLASPEYAKKQFTWRYTFWCYDGIFELTDGTVQTDNGMIYKFRSDNIDAIEVYDDIEVWFWTFNIEPGTYAFTTGMDDITVLDSSLQYTEKEEKVTVKDGDHVRLYSLFGPWDWIEPQIDTLTSYAKKREAELGYGHPTPAAKEEATEAVMQEEAEPEEPEAIAPKPQAPVEKAEPPAMQESQEPPKVERSLLEKALPFAVLAIVLGFVIVAVAIIVAVLAIKKNRQ